MRLVTWSRGDGVFRSGALIDDDHRVVDLAAAYEAARGGAAPSAVTSLLGLIEGGADALDLARELVASPAAAATLPRAEVRLHAPLQPPPQLRDFSCFELHLRNSFAAARRFKVRKEPDPEAAYRALDTTQDDLVIETFKRQPIYYKANRFSVVGIDDEVIWPSYSRAMDFELEWACYIGRKVKDVPAEEARDVIFGYTIYNDFSARDAHIRRSDYVQMKWVIGPVQSEDGMTIRAMDHFTIVTDRLDETLAFYASLGLIDGPRPDFGIGGAWLYAADRPILHIVEVERMPEPRRGALDHMAFTSEGLLGVVQRLSERGTPYRIIRTPSPFSRWQMFIEDPNGVEVELDFDISETPPEDWKQTAARMRAPALMGSVPEETGRRGAIRSAFERLPDNTRGAFWLLVSSVTFTAMTVLIKSLNGYSAAVQAIYSQIAGLLLMVPLVVRSRGQVLVLHGVWMQLARSLSAALGVTLSYFAVQTLPLADANAISFTRALWIGPLAMLVLRDRVSRSTWLALIIGFGGVLLIARPSTATEVGWAHLAAILSAFFLALSITGIKVLTRKNSVATIMVWSAILGVLLLTPIAAGSWRWPSVVDFLLLATLGALSVVTSGTYIHGMALGDPAKLASVDYVRLPMAIVAGFLAFGEVPGVWTLVGSAIVVGTALWAALSEHRATPIEPSAAT